MRERAINPGRSGFTVLELLVALGVLVLVAVAVGTIFTSVGDTVNAGRRLSTLNKTVAQLERVMREDIERMSRSGFLVIRNEYAVRDGTDVGTLGAQGFKVRRLEGDAGARPRRVDQFMFFAEGTFVSQRPDVVPGLATVASEARIWYGHGQRRVPERSDLTSRWAEPSLADDLTSSNVPALGAFDETGSRLGFDPGPGVENPNEFANDWMLLRHVTLLTPPSDQRAQRLPSLGAAGLYGVTFDLNNLNERARLADSVFQVNLQPAVSGVFWNAQALDPAAVNPTLPGYVDGFTGQTRRVTTLAYPTEELAAARTASGLVDIATTTLTDIETVATRGQFDVRTVRGRADFLAKLAQQRGGTVFPLTRATSEQQWRWMVNALPTPPVELDQREGNFGKFTTPRIRAEIASPNADTANQASSLSGTAAIDRAYEQSDQQVLTRWPFVPRCTEFIVEWSYGTIDTSLPTSDPAYGQLLWYGRDRWEDKDGDFVRDNDEPWLAREYRPRPGASGDPQRELLTGGFAGSRPVNQPETVAFGYADRSPTSQIEAERWPWPKLLRVTVSFADATNPEVEQSFQLLFDVPQE